MLGRLLIATVLATLVVPASAAAAQRYASTSGTGSGCTQPAPCSIETAVNSATSNDEVIIAPGTYTTSTSLANGASGLSIHGADPFDPPVIKSSAGNAVYFNGFSVDVADLRIDHTGNLVGAVFFSSSATFTRIEVHSSSASGACDTGPQVILRDVLCASSEPGAFAIRDSFTGSPNTSRFRNVTAVATGESSIGLEAGAGSGTTNIIDAKNVILQGVPTDVSVETSSPGATVAVSFTNSNYKTVETSGNVIVTPAGSGTNQTAEPKFAERRHYTEDPRSPTVDAGTTDAYTDFLDPGGELRPLGAAMDIGVDELVPDGTAPATTIIKGPKKKTTTPKATFKFKSNEKGAFLCALDAKAPKPCKSPKKLKRLKPGRHRFTVVAVDYSGNADPTPAAYKWKVKPKR